MAVRYALVLSFVIAAAGLSGCSTVRSPAATVSEVRTTAVSPQGARVEVVVELINPNDIPLPLPNTSYAVTVEGVGTFRYDDPAGRVLPAGGTQVLVFPAAFARQDGAVSGHAYSVAGSAAYEPPGEFRAILTQSGIPLPRVYFASSGRLE